MSASYLSDALGDLLDALHDLCGAATSARVSWEEEPGEFRWLFTRDGEEVAVRVLWFRDQFDQAPDVAGDERLAGSVNIKALVAAVVAGTRAVLQEHGEQGYRALWDRHPFPTAKLTALEDAAARL